MTARIFYTGDLNIEHGGFFYTLEGFAHGYADACRVTPCTDAGGPTNLYWVEKLVINVGDNALLAYSGKGDNIYTRRAHRALHGTDDKLAKDIDRIEQALGCVGFDQRLAEWDKLTKAQRRHAIVYACESYGYTDTEQQWNVSVGTVQDAIKKRWNVDVVLRANASLRNFAYGKMK